MTIKQYDSLIKEISPLAMTAPKGSVILMTDSLFNEIKSVFDQLFSKDDPIYYFLGLRVDVVVTNTRILRWWIVKGYGVVNETI